MLLTILIQFQQRKFTARELLLFTMNFCFSLSGNIKYVFFLQNIILKILQKNQERNCLASG